MKEIEKEREVVKNRQKLIYTIHQLTAYFSVALMPQLNHVNANGKVHTGENMANFISFDNE